MSTNGLDTFRPLIAYNTESCTLRNQIGIQWQALPADLQETIPPFLQQHTQAWALDTSGHITPGLPEDPNSPSYATALPPINDNQQGESVTPEMGSPNG